jgi:hypothetical protein
MLFIFFLVVIALATILDIGSLSAYGAKRNLALLIVIGRKEVCVPV